VILITLRQVLFSRGQSTLALAFYTSVNRKNTYRVATGDIH
jgi:hypothetical protein